MAYAYVFLTTLMSGHRDEGDTRRRVGRLIAAWHEQLKFKWNVSVNPRTERTVVCPTTAETEARHFRSS